MNSDLVKEIFRNFENTFIARLRAIEDILTSTKQSTEVTAPVDLTEVNQKIDAAVGYIKSVEEYAMGEVRTIVYNADKLEERVSFLERELAKCTLTMEASTKQLVSLSEKIDSILLKETKDDRPVEAVMAEVELETAEAEALELEEEAGQEEAEEEEEQEETEEQEEEVEEEQSNVEPFEYSYLDKKTKKIVKITLYHDAEYNVYQEDEDGGIDSTIIGKYDPKTKKFTRI